MRSFENALSHGSYVTCMRSGQERSGYMSARVRSVTRICFAFWKAGLNTGKLTRSSGCIA